MWITLIMMLISYFMSAKSGNSKGKSAAIAAAVGLGSYWATQNVSSMAEANASIGNLFSSGDPAVNGVTESVAREGIVSSVAASAGSTVSSLGSSAAGVLTSWGPTGTVGVIAGTAAASAIDWKSWLPWVAGGAAIFLLMKD